MAEINQLEPVELKARLDRGDNLAVLDVREHAEIALAAFPDATHIPMGEIPERIPELDPDIHWVVVCHHGIRSAQVAIYLAGMGFTVTNLSGGIDRWSLEIDPSIPRY
jgi:rhodanese-related sulfurtransferase